jgi:hypothetical protein
MSPTVSELMHIILHNLLSNERIELTVAVLTLQVKDRYYKMRSMNDVAISS